MASKGARAGHVDLDASSYSGAVGPILVLRTGISSAVPQGSHILASPSSIRGVDSNVSGHGFAASIEGGYPIVLAPWLIFKPQIQAIWQRVSFDNTLDPFSTTTFDGADVFTGRAGAVLRGTFGSTGALWRKRASTSASRA